MRIILYLVLSISFLAHLSVMQNGVKQLSLMSTHQSDLALPDTLIHMERTMCFGTCPAYELTISQNGVVTFVGKQYVNLKGKAESQISEERMEQLIRKIHESDFMEIPSNPECESRMTDLPSVYLTIKIDGKRHYVNHYHGCRGFENEEKLYELENAIDSLAGVERWVGD